MPGRAFLRRAYALTHGAKKLFHHIKFTTGTKSDFVMLLDFQTEYHGWSFFFLDKVHTDQALQLYTWALPNQLDVGRGWAVLGSRVNGPNSGRGLIQPL